VVPLFGGSSEPSNAASSPAREATVAEVTDVS
jgi:hypothetical protein